MSMNSDKGQVTRDKDNTTICIIRHGETDWNASGRLQGNEDIELNETGRMQARQLATFLNKDKWDLIVTSPLKRAYETAQIIADTLSVSNIVAFDKLKERDYGMASGLLPAERKERFADGVIPGQEEFEHLRQRAMDALTDILDRYMHKNILVVSHGAITNSILYTLSNGTY